jgi:Tol biopolymer transport system component
MSRDGSGERALTDDAALDEYPTWSPDGNRIAFQSMRDGEFDIFVMSGDGQDEVNITNHPPRDQWASWSPDGEFIAFMSERDGSEDVFVMRPDGSDVRNLTQTPDLQESHPAWSPDGTLTFIRHGESGPITLWAVSLDGGSEIRIETPAEPVFAYSWGPR